MYRSTLRTINKTILHIMLVLFFAFFLKRNDVVIRRKKQRKGMNIRCPMGAQSSRTKKCSFEHRKGNRQVRNTHGRANKTRVNEQP